MAGENYQIGKGKEVILAKGFRYIRVRTQRVAV